MNIDINIDEVKLSKKYPVAFKVLLRCHTRYHYFKQRVGAKEAKGHEFDDENLITWAIDDYAYLGEEFKADKPMTLKCVTTLVDAEGKILESPKKDDEVFDIIRPRCKKPLLEQTARTKDKAEVFTPSWVCNAQNNLIDEAWFGRKDVFNREVTLEDGTHSWIPTEGKIVEFPEDKTWKDYVADTRMEITCGEAPYLVSRYDTTTGQPIPLDRRIGLLDRKLRLISENCNTEVEWLEAAYLAYKNIYGYEWQGDNLLLAREALLATFLEYFYAKFGELPQKKKETKSKEWVKLIAYVISWNIWQMDGLKFVLPNSCKQANVCVNQKEIDNALIAKERAQAAYEKAVKDAKLTPALPGFEVEIPEPHVEIPESKYEQQECPGCKNNDINQHTGMKAIIREWDVFDDSTTNENGVKGNKRCDITFLDFYNRNK